MNHHIHLFLLLQLLLLCQATLSNIAHCQQSLLQARTTSQKIDSIITQSAARTANNQRDLQTLDPVQSARSLKFYMPLIGKTCENTVYPTTRVDPGKSTLKAFSDWLWVVEDEHYDFYVQHRLACSMLVNSMQEADLCYPTCTETPSLTSKTDAMPSANVHRSSRNRHKKFGYMPQVCFEVPWPKKSSWSGCSSLCLQPEASGKCSVEVPYLHGIIWPLRSQDNQVKTPPWEFNFARTTLLAFVGGDHRGWFLDRAATIREMQNEASRINAASPETVFSAHIIKEPEGQHENDWLAYGRTQEFYLDAWELYASANFSWQPYGDTSTRRALYDSLMFGSIPVIDTRAARYYRNLFNGTLWEDVALENVFVVIPEDADHSGQAILQTLVSMPSDEVDKRRRGLRQIASSLQWGEHTPDSGDAFEKALRSFHSGPLLDE